jgi:phosphomannomutase / phosphoglucomutase
MGFSEHIFREYDIRGLADKDFDAAFAEVLGRAYCEFAKKALGKDRLKIGVGQDCRLTSESYASALARGILASGCDVVRLGTIPTPVTYFSIFEYELDGGIMITGSHNPSEYNGFKICVGRDTLHGDDIQRLKEIILKATDPIVNTTPGKLTQLDPIPSYIDTIAKQIKPKKKLRVVLDAGNGAASNVAPELFERLGADVVPLFCELDGRFPNHHPDPTVPKNLKSLVEKIKETDADFGVGFDGDADRLGAVDKTGRIIFGDELMVVFSRAVLEANPGATIISEVKSSHRLYQDIKNRGGRGIMWKTGHSLIKSKMKTEKALLAGEMSGHVFFADRWYGFDDAIYSAARLYEILSKTEGSVFDLIKDLPPVQATPEIRLDCEEDKKFQLVKETAAALSDAAGFTVNTIDGIRIDSASGWGLVRASNTQPVLVLRFEAESQERLNSIRTLVLNALNAAAKKVGHATFAAEEAQ